MRRVLAIPGFARRGAVLAVLAGALLLLASGAALAANHAVTVQEHNERYSFNPADITVAVGDTVTWHDDTDAPHTVTSDGSGPLNGSLNPGGPVYSQTFNTAGDFAYHCTIHTYMHGVIHVESMPATDALASFTSVATGPDAPWMLLAVAGVALLASGALTLAIRRRRVIAE